MYATGDLLMSHPDVPGLWKIFGRVDDQIMHSNGEKVVYTVNWPHLILTAYVFTETNPGPLGV